MRLRALWIATFATVLMGTAGAENPTLTQGEGLDLSESTWIFTPEGGDPAVVQLPGTVTSPSGSGVLTTLFDLPNEPMGWGGVLGTELTIGHVQGRDSVRVNGVPIGTSSGMAISATGVPRQYVIPNEALHFDDPNTLEIRLTSLGGGEGTEIRGPITLAALGTQGLWAKAQGLRSRLERTAQMIWAVDWITPRDLRSHQTQWRVHRNLLKRIADAEKLLGESEAHEAASLLHEVEDALWSFTHEIGLLHDEALALREESTHMLRAGIAANQGVPLSEVHVFDSGFGRFGEWHEDGTPYLSKVTPMEVEGPGQMTWRVAMDDVLGAQVVDINWISKTTLVVGERNGQPCDVATTVSLPYPGVLYEQRRGDVLAFDLRNVTADELQVTSMPEWYGSAPLNRPIEENRTILVRRLAEEETFWLLHSEVPFENVQVGPSSDGIRLTLEFANGSNHRVALLPVHGVELVDTREIHAPEYEAFQQARANADHVPVRMDEIYRVDQANQRVYLFDHFEHRSVIETIPFEERPVWFPILARFAEEEMGEDVEIDVRHFIELPSQSTFGPAAMVRSDDSIAAWSIPLPDLGGRFNVRPTGNGDLVDQLNQHLTDLGQPTMINGVDRTYKSRAQGYQAWNLLDEVNRDRLTANSEALIPTTFDPAIWHRWEEGFTGTPTWYTYTIEGPGYDLYDQDWGNGLTLYALSLWAMVEGRYDALGAHTDVLDQMMAWYLETEDWAWLRNSNANHGHGTGAGDCSMATYAGLLGAARIWEALGEDAKRDEAMLLLARTSLSITTRFALTDWARDAGVIAEDELIIGFHEGEGFLTGSMTSYPWNATSMISGNGVQPEAHDMLLERIPDLYAGYEAQMIRHNPTIFDGSADYGHPTLYQGNSGYITLPHIYAQARLGAPIHRLRRWLENAGTNDYLWWQAPTAISEIVGRENGFVLLDWEPAKLVDAWVGDDDQVQVIFEARGDSLRWRARMDSEPTGVTVNGESTVWAWDTSDQILTVTASSGGTLEFSVER